MYQLQQQTQYFKPIIVADQEIIDWFKYILVPARELVVDDMIWGKLNDSECQNCVVRCITHYDEYCIIMISEFAGKNWYTDFFSSDDMFLVSNRWRGRFEECDEF